MNPNDFVDYTDFPYNGVLVIAEEASLLPGLSADAIFKRPLRPTDLSVSIGIVPTLWQPVEYEIGQQPASISRYSYAIQCMIRHADETAGLVAHANLSKRIRRMVDNGGSVSLRLGQLQVVDGPLRERTLKAEVTNQQFLSNEVDASFMYLSVIELQLETETVKA